jgi:hypothetical protein
MAMPRNGDEEKSMTNPVGPDGTADGTPARGPGPRADPGVDGNERLTSIAGLLLLVLMAVEIFTVPTLHALMTVHVLVGVVLAGPLVVKLASAGYRFTRYYTGAPAYVRRGPPRLPLRLLAPVLVAATLVLLASGIGMVLAGPSDAGQLVALHNLSFLVWLPLVAVHAVAYVVRAVRQGGADASRSSADAPGGRGWRLSANGAALLLGAVGALVLLPNAQPWVAWIQSNEQVPAPLIVGLVLTVAGLLVVRPARWS